MEKMCECGLVEVNDCRCAEYEGVVDPFDNPPWEVDEDDIDWGETGEDYPIEDDEHWKDSFDWDDNKDDSE